MIRFAIKKDIPDINRLGLILNKNFTKTYDIDNYLRNDRYNETKFKIEKQKLYLDENLVYQMSTSGIPSIDKNRLDKNSIDKISIDIDSIFGEENV